MTDDHDGVRDLLAAWAFGALPPAEEQAVPGHLAECATCAAEAERLRETVRLLDGPAPDRTQGHSTLDVLSTALRARPATPRVAAHAAPYAAAVAGLRALLPEAEGRWGTPVVHDWDVHATVAHLPGGKKITWRASNREGFFVGPKGVRVLKVPTVKE